MKIRCKAETVIFMPKSQNEKKPISVLLGGLSKEFKSIHYFNPTDAP